MPLSKVRVELNLFDNTIKNILALRMSMIPIVADIKNKNGMPFFQPGREEEIYNRMTAFADFVGMNPELLKEIWKSIIADAMRIEEAHKQLPDVAPNPTATEIIHNIEKLCEQIDEQIQEFNKLSVETGKTISELSTEFFAPKLS